MNEFKITCPNCEEEFELTETLAETAVAEMRKQVLAESKKREDSLVEREEKISASEADLTRSKANIASEVARQVSDEQKKIKKQAEKEAKADVATEVEDLEKKLAAETKQRKKAETEELRLRNEAEDLAKDKDEWDLEKKRQLEKERKTIKSEVQKTVDEETRLKLAEKDKTIADMEKKVIEAQRTAAQGSQQTQGEVLELDIQDALERKFPLDEIEEVKKGQRGADIRQEVYSAPGVRAGTILWETKNAENWGADWIQKVKQDARDSKAEIPVIVSTVLPKGVRVFGEVDGVWVCEPAFATVIGVALRTGLVEASDARRASEGAATKAERLYQYMMSPEFRSWLEGIAEPFQQMQSDLVSEKRTMYARWNKREKQLERVMTSVAGLSGDLQGIAGDELPELPFSDEDALAIEQVEGDKEKE